MPVKVRWLVPFPRSITALWPPAPNIIVMSRTVAKMRAAYAAGFNSPLKIPGAEPSSPNGPKQLSGGQPSALHDLFNP